MRVVLMSDAADRPQQDVTGRWEAISTFNNFLYQESCITVWKAYDIGQEKTVSWSQLHGNSYNSDEHLF